MEGQLGGIVTPCARPQHYSVWGPLKHGYEVPFPAPPMMVVMNVGNVHFNWDQGLGGVKAGQSRETQDCEEV